jgi:glutamyl-tRNA synthetase
MTVRVRIAPSPTGNLHIGTARTAVFNWLFARHHGGKFILRIEDTDVERSKPEYTENILEGLQWLGLTWDEGPFFQTKRLDWYRQATQELLDKGLAYRCYVSSEELEAMRETQKARKEAPRYDNRHRNLTPEQQAAYEAEGRQPVIRFKIEDDREITWQDMVRGQVSWKGSDLGGDMVIARASQEIAIGQPLYNLAVVVDDIDMKITHVIRGEDHIANTAKQILLYEALEATVPTFAHTPLILSPEGRKLSKRDGVTAIADFKKMGFVAPALANYMTLLGWSHPETSKEIFTLEEAAKDFSFDRVNRAGAKFDWAKLDWINSQYLHPMAAPELLALLVPHWQAAGYEFDLESDRSWLEPLTTLLAESLTRLEDAVPMSKAFFATTVELSPEATAHLEQPGAKEAIGLILPHLDQSLEATTASELIQKTTKELKVKKPVVMKALRAALTGELHGTDLVQTWVILHQRGLDKPRLESVISEQ